MIVEWQGIEILEPDIFDTPDGGKIMLGRCSVDDQHLVVFAHINLTDAEGLAQAIMTAVTRFQGGGTS